MQAAVESKVLMSDVIVMKLIANHNTMWNDYTDESKEKTDHRMDPHGETNIEHEREIVVML